MLAMMEMSNIDEAAHALGMVPRMLDWWIARAGLSDLFCMCCYCDKSGESCACGAINWGAIPTMTSERGKILGAMGESRNDLDEAARRLDMHPQTLAQRIVVLELTEPVCEFCYLDKPASGECWGCGADRWVALPEPPIISTRTSTPTPRSVPAPRAPLVLPAPNGTLEQRILNVVREGDLPNTNAIVSKIRGRRQDVYAAVKRMLGDGRLRFDDRIFRAGG
jgi:hypothetical protein